MSVSGRIEAALESTFVRARASAGPPRLNAAMRYAVFPSGARIRPRLTLAVAAAVGEDEPMLVDAAAAAVELLHCASLVHDDMPCFDDADLRRGKPAVHKQFDERIALLAGDGLIVLAFQTLAACAARPRRLGDLVTILAQSVGAPCGIVAGQAWECEPLADLSTYHRQKTGALFAGAAMLGAAASGAEPQPWRTFGEALGQAYQAADDIGDAESDEATLGKPVGRDKAFGRPSLVTQLGLDAAVNRFDDLVDEAIALVPPCAGAADLESLISVQARRLIPKHLCRQAA